MRTLRALAMSIVLVCACTPLAAAPTRAQIAALESTIVMPEGAEELDSYARFYSSRDGQWIDGELFLGDLAWMLEHRTISQRLGPRTFIVSPNNMPGIRDGGCGVLTLRYDTQTREMQGPACNGLA